MKHIIFDPTNPFGDSVLVYTCFMDNGNKVRPNALYSLGNGSVAIVPCVACAAEIQAAVLNPLMVDAMQNELKSRGTFWGNGKMIVYRGYKMMCSPNYEIPEVGSEEYSAILRGLDNYIDEGKPINLVGIDIMIIPIDDSEST